MAPSEVKPSYHLIYLVQLGQGTLGRHVVRNIAVRCLEMGHGHRPVEIKTFRPEISSVDIMIAGVSSCLLPLGGGGDDECGVMEQISPVLSVRSCNTAVLSWRYLHPAQPSSVITSETVKQIWPCW